MGDHSIDDQSDDDYCGPMWIRSSSLSKVWSSHSFIWPGLVLQFLPQDTTPTESTPIYSYPRVPLHYLDIKRHGSAKARLRNPAMPACSCSSAAAAIQIPVHWFKPAQHRHAGTPSRAC